MEDNCSESSLRPPSSLLIERPVEHDEPNDAIQNEKAFDLPDVFSPTPEDASPISLANAAQAKKISFESFAVFSSNPKPASPALPVQDEEQGLDLPAVFSSSAEAPSPTKLKANHYMPSSSSRHTSSVELISTPAILKAFESGDLERLGAPAREVLRGQFPGPRPCGDPSLLSRKYELVYPPPSRDAYPNIERFPFTFVESSKPVELREPMDGYNEQSDKLADFLSSQNKKYAEDYTKYSRQREKLSAAWERINDARYAQAEREAKKPTHDLNLGGHKIIQPLTRSQQREISVLEMELAPLMEKVVLNRAETEGTIAAAFMFHWDYADEVPTAHQRAVLRETGGFEKFIFEKEKVEVKTGLDYVVTQADLTGHAISRNPNQPLFDDIKAESKKVYREAFLKQRKEYHPPSPPPSRPASPVPEPVETPAEAPWEAFLTVKPKTTTKKDDPVSPLPQVPEWFTRFVTYNIVKFESLKIQDQFTEFLRLIKRLESRLNHTGKQAAVWDMEWHQPNPSWSTLARQTSGG